MKDLFILIKTVVEISLEENCLRGFSKSFHSRLIEEHFGKYRKPVNIVSQNNLAIHRMAFIIKKVIRA